MSKVRISVVIPTYERRQLVLDAVRSLAAQRDAPPFDVTVVVDGSTDGTGEALRALSLPWLRVVEQTNQGAAAARNAGAATSTGELLLFLDDDMEAAADLLAVHDAAHREGADVVLGHMPLHPGAPRTVVSAAVEAWTRDRHDRLAGGEALELHDLLTGQISIARPAFDAVGGFDLDFTHDGAFGGEDIDFGHRLRAAGRRIAFVPEAVSHQRYTISGRSYLRQWEQAGWSDAVLERKHPELTEELPAPTPENRALRVLLRLCRAGAPGRALLDVLVVCAAQVVDRGRTGPRAAAVVFAVRDLAYAYGRAAAGAGHVAVLALHAIADLRGDPLLERYAVPPAEFDRILRQLRRRCTFVSLDDLLAALAGRRAMPRRGVLLTFDDGYTDLHTEVAPRLRGLGIDAVAFAVSGLLGRTNRWDQAAGAATLRLLDAEQLRQVSPSPITIGAHSRTHPALTGCDDTGLQDEVAGPIDDLVAAGLPRPSAFCFPYGDVDDRVVETARGAGYRAAFTLTPTVVRPGADPLRLPRIEVHRGDAGLRLRAKLALARLPPRVAARLGR